MMISFSIFIYVAMFIVIIMRILAGASSGKQEKRKESVPPGTPNLPKERNGNVLNVPADRPTAIPNVPEEGKSAVPNVPRKKHHHTFHLEPHMEETLQPQIRTNNLWGEDKHAGNRKVALRLMEGDAVPDGYVRIKCPYCGADNLVTKNCRQYHSCYFCRVPID